MAGSSTGRTSDFGSEGVGSIPTLLTTALLAGQAGRLTIQHLAASGQPQTATAPADNPSRNGSRALAIRKVPHREMRA